MSSFQSVFSDVWFWVESLWGGLVTSQRVISLLESAYQTADQMFGEGEALGWAEGFVIPSEVANSNVEMFDQCNRDLHLFIKEFRLKTADHRISCDSVHSAISRDNPEYSKLMDLIKGMPLFLDEDFVPNGPSNIPRLSSTYSRLAPAVDRMLYEDFVVNGLAFVLPKDVVLAYVPQFHLSRLSWTMKHGKKKGRPILDCSAGDPSVNSDYTKLSCDNKWGVIQHPTISSLVLMILDFWCDMTNSHTDIVWADLVLWKIDLKGAYTLISFEDAAVPFMAAEMSNDTIVFFTCGVFGWSGTPASFQVVSRALSFQINSSISGRISIYVDDLFGVSIMKLVDNDIKVATSICCELFHSDCVESTKTVRGRVVEVIGYTIDLDLGRVSVSQKNFLRVIYGLSTMPNSGVIPVKVLQKFASWVSRYSSIFNFLKPLSKNIYDSFAGYSNQHVCIHLTDQLVMTLRLFRAIFIMGILRDDLFSRPFRSFRMIQPQIVIEFDASLFGCGVILYAISGTEERFLGSVSVSLSTLKFGHDSSFQNAAEFIAAVVGLVVTMKLCEPGTCVKFRGDSISALTWLQTFKFKSILIHKMATLYTYVCLRHGFHISDSSHICALDNQRADFLSRHVSEACGDIVVDVNPLLEVVDPSVPIDTDEQYIQFWNRLPIVVNHVLSSIKNPPNLSLNSF